MRPILIALLFLLFAPIAHADSYRFTFSGAFQPNMYSTKGYGPELSFSWVLSGLPVPVLLEEGVPPDLEYLYVPFSPNPFANQANVSLFSYADIDPASPEQSVTFSVTESGFYGDAAGYNERDFGGVNLPKSFFLGPVSNPTFLPGVYDAEFELHDLTIYDGTLQVSDVTAVTPEPSSLMLLVTGLLGVVALRRFRHA